MRIVRTLFVLSTVLLIGFAVANEPGGSAPIAADAQWLQPHGANLYSSGQPTEAQLQFLQSKGVGTVIDLRADDETPDFDEASRVRSLGLDYLGLPVRGKNGLTRENVAAFDALLARAGDRPLLVHCASGNRVGAMMALRERWQRGATPEQALAIGREWGMKSLELDVEALLRSGPQSAQAMMVPQATDGDVAPAMRADTSN